MHSLLKGLLIVFGLTFASCIPLAPTVCPTLSPSYKEQDTQVALADFAISLFKNVTSRDEQKNQILSPVSIALALTLLESGADGKTQQDLQRVLLETAATREHVLAVYQQFQRQLSIDQDKSKLTIANALFQDKTLKVSVDYSTAISQCLNSQITEVDFQHQLEQTRQQINQFVSQKTQQKIPELFKPGVLTQQDRFVLANAIYFKASWQQAFTKQQTKQDTFYRNGQDAQKVQFMQQTHNLRHGSTNDADALELPYVDHDLSLYVVLPKQRDGIRNLEKQLTGQQLRNFISNLEYKQVEVHLPKFTVRSSFDLTTILKSIGLASLFNDEANFSRLSETPLKVDSSVHEAYLNLDENGTEGAAATGTGGRANVIPHFTEPPTQFKADHPFLYAVVHKQSGAVVFLGKVNSVEQQGQ